MIVSLSFEPFALWQARQHAPEATAEAPHVALAGERVVARDAVARRAGIAVGMGRSAARARAADLREIPAASPQLESAWRGVLLELYRHTPWLDTTGPGVATLRLDADEAQRLAVAFGVRAGAAEHREQARLLALAARPGQLRAGAEAEVAQLPLALLRGLGVADGTLQRLTWLGLERLGQLQRWSPAQLGALFGTETATVLRHLHGPYRSDVATFTLPPTVRSHLDIDDACRGATLEPALALLADGAAAQLGDRAASRLTLHASAQGIAFSASRVAKRPLRDPAIIARLARLALADGGAGPLGVDTLTLELGDLSRPSRQGSLWRRRERLERAIGGVERRFPGSLLRIEPLDPHALAFEHRARLIPWRSDGGERARTADADRRRTPQRVA